MTANEAYKLLQNMIEIPSLSREETAVADFLQNYLENIGLEINRVGNNLFSISKDYSENKPTILLNSHIDTVKPSALWTKDPFKATEEDGKLYGLGTNDAGASVVSLICTFVKLTAKPQPYNLILGISCQEEVSGKEGMELLITQLPKVDFAIVGEPTLMKLAVAERGLMVVDCEAKGKSGHAAREEGINAIYEALDDIKWFKDYRFPKVSPVLGPVKMTVSILQSGTQHNVVPDSCKFTVDIRLNECYTHQEVFDTIQENIKSEAKARSMRLKPSSTDMGHPFVQAYLKTEGEVFGSSTLSDQALLSIPSVKIGPGDSARSHTADEYIRLSEIEEAIEMYTKLLDNLEIL